MKLTIFKEKLAQLDERVAKFMRKYPDVPVVYEKSESYFAEITDEKTGARRWVERVDVELDARYKINGWEFIAALDFDCNTRKNIIRRNPNFDGEIPQQYWTSCKCDHCKHNVYRIHTTLMRNEAGEWKQVGNKCVKEFIGIDLSNFSTILDAKDIYDDYCELPSTIPYLDKLQDVMEQAIAEISKHGFISGKTAAETGDYATADRVCSIMRSGKLYAISDEIEERAKEIIKYFATIEPRNEYENNANIVASNMFVDGKTIRFVPSMVHSYNKHLERIEQSASSEWAGQVGDKIIIECSIKFKGSRFTQYGVMHLYELNDGKNIYNYATSKAISCINGTYKVQATIKALRDKFGSKQTDVTRVKIISAPQPEAPTDDVDKALKMFFDSVE